VLGIPPPFLLCYLFPPWPPSHHPRLIPQGSTPTTQSLYITIITNQKQISFALSLKHKKIIQKTNPAMFDISRPPRLLFICSFTRQTGRSAAWLARLNGVQKVGGSNPPAPTIASKSIRPSDTSKKPQLVESVCDHLYHIK
jgi:hypothetical protein